MVKKRHRPESQLWEKPRPAAQDLHRHSTPAEKILWRFLRNRRFQDYQFGCNYPIDRFVVDFCCPKAALVIEVDGPMHDRQKEEGQAREECLAAIGYG